VPVEVMCSGSNAPVRMFGVIVVLPGPLSISIGHLLYLELFFQPGKRAIQLLV
jgi:hypothetical protein